MDDRDKFLSMFALVFVALVVIRASLLGGLLVFSGIAVVVYTMSAKR